MATWRSEGRQPPQAVLDLIVGYLHRVARPVYLGTVSLHIRWSLERTREMMDVLQDRGLVVPLAADELERVGFEVDADAWRLVGGADPAKARW